jgi:hypothetical protein
MDLAGFLRTYADQIGGQYTAYNADQSILIVPLPDNRFQTVIGNFMKTGSNQTLFVLSSKVSNASDDYDYRTLLEASAGYHYCRVVIRDNQVQVEAVAAVDGVSEEAIKEMVQEVANRADQLEMELTGSDVH